MGAWVLLAVFTVSCGKPKVTVEDAGPTMPDLTEKCIDADGDGQAGTGDCDRLPGRDCDDERSDVFHGAPEICDGIDNNCDGQVDEGLTVATYYRDRDGDGFGGTEKIGGGCGLPPLGSVARTGDCDDENAARYPGREETCNGVDDDCDGAIDNGLAFQDFFEDKDGDGFGSPSVAALNSCLPQISGRVSNNADCNDAVATVRPGAPEQCNKVDDNCDGQVDNGISFDAYYPDIDGDGFGAANATAEQACAPVSGKVTNHTDCNDSSAAVKPGVAEVCNGLDDNCDGRIDEGLAFSNYYVDADADGFGAASGALLRACAPVQGRVTNNGDCNDTNAAIKPGATEKCDGTDDDCDGVPDDGLAFTTYYPDSDGDGFGATNGAPQTACAPVAGKVTNKTDCDDTRASVKPGAAEVCNGLDDNCAGGIDEGLTFVSYYPDGDGDGFGAVSGTAQSACSPISGKVANHTDCDDTKALVKPGAPESCNGIDDNCDGQIDNGVSMQNYYVDADSDGFGAAGSMPQASCSVVPGRVTNSGDCNDGNAAVKPGASELCNGSDDNCNGNIDDGLTFQSYYTDADSDGFGSSLAVAQAACAQVPGKVTNNTDCNDGSAAVKPGANELCNGADDNCAGGIDEGNPQGGAACTTGQSGICSAGTRVCQSGMLNCVRTNNPVAESCNGLDDNCDGATDEPWPTKGQTCSGGVGVCTRSGVLACNGSGTQLVCNATPGSPTAPACDGLDNDCDGIVDEPYWNSTANVNTPVAWTDVEVRPWYYTASSCAGGTAGTGTDALAGGAMVMASGTGGVYFQRLDTQGSPVGDPVGATSTLRYNDVDMAQAGDGFIVAGIYRDFNTPTGIEIDLFYMDAATGVKRAFLWSQFNTGNALDSLRVVRGNGKRVVVLWREAGVGFKAARIEPMYDSLTGSWNITGPAGGAVTSQLWLASASAPEGLGADSTHIDWTSSQTCSPVSSLRTVAVARAVSATELRVDSALEDGTSPASVGVVTVTAPEFITEPELVFFRQAGADHFFGAFVTKDPNNFTADLNYWLSTVPTTVSFAYLAFGVENGVNSILRPRASVTASQVLLTALRYEAASIGNTRQVMSRTIDFLGNKLPSGSIVEISATSVACAPTETACRPGEKSALTSWASVGKVYYSASGASPQGTYVSAASCQ